MTMQTCGSNPTQSTARITERDRAPLAAMRHYAQTASRWAESWKWEADETDSCTFLAISQCLKVIGGAATQVSSKAVPEAISVSWPKVMGLRDRMAKEYRTVTPGLVIAIVRNDL